MNMKKSLFTISLILALVGVVLICYYFIIPFVSPLKKQPPLPTSPELAEIQKRGKLIIGTEALYPPMEYFDENGNIVGIDIEIGKRIAESLGVQAEFRHIPWQELFDKLLEKEVDILISAITILPEREEIMAFSKPYFNAGQIIVTTKDKANVIKGVEDLHDKKIGVQAQTTSEEEALKISTNVISYADYEEAKKDLLEGKIDAIIIDYPAAIGMTSQIKELTIVGKPFTQEFYGIALRKEDQALLEAINQILSEMQRRGELEEIISQWIKR